MRRPLKRSIERTTSLVLGLGAFALNQAEGANSTLLIGGDEQFRPVEHHSRVIWFGPDHAPALDGPPVDCMRWRERLWMDYHPNEGASLLVRLTHRWWHFNSRPGPNDEKRTTWRFPDEVVIDNLLLTLSRVGDSDWSLRLGRQDLWNKGQALFGSGMILNDATTLDGGRTCYADGLIAEWKPAGDGQWLRLGVFIQTWKDRFLIFNDVQRPLRPGNTQIAALDWMTPISLQQRLNVFVYEIKTGDALTQGQRADVQVTGFRLLSSKLGPLTGSLEFAHQFGEYQGGVPSARMKTCGGNMADLRLGLPLSSSSSLKFQYTFFSGDKASTNDTYEGWHPLLAANVPLYREECFYTLNKGWWSDLHHVSLLHEVRLSEGDAKNSNAGRIVLSTGWTSLYTAQNTNGGGHHLGEMPSLFFDWQPKPWLKINLLGALLLPGNYYRHHQAGEWLRFETMFSF